MPDPNLILDRVTHVSLVDEPAVGDSEFVVMKRADEEDPESIEDALDIAKAGRTISQANLENLAGIYNQISGSHPQAASKLADFLREASADDQDVDSILEDKNMDDEKIEELLSGVEKAASAASEAAEAATEAAEAAQETETENPEGTGSGEGQEPEGGEGQAQDGQGISPELDERLSSIEESLGLQEEEQEAEGQEGENPEGQTEEELEKRLNAIEKGLQNQGDGGDGRQGTASALDHLQGNGSSGTVRKDIKGAVTQEDN